MDRLLQDLRFAARIFKKTPAVTLAALLSLALGIGANTAIFTFVNAFFLRGLPVERPDRLVNLYVTGEDKALANSLRISHPNFADVAALPDLFSGLTEIGFAPADLTQGGGEPEQVAGQMVTANFFGVLGVRPALGRFFADGEDQGEGGHPLLVLNHAFWSRRLAADPDAVGRTLTLNGKPFTVIGVAPPGFRGTLLLIDPAFWVPLSERDAFLQGEQRRMFNDRRALLLRAYGRLQDGVSVSQAEEAVRTLGANLAQEYPVENKGRGLGLLPIAQAMVDPEQRSFYKGLGALLMAIVGLVLLVACGNVANLLLGRARARRREIAVRLSLGASRRRLMLQLITESLLLALAAGALGLLFAVWGRNLLWTLRPAALANAPLDLSFDPRVLGFSFGLALLTGLLFGLAPAIQATRPTLVADLKQESDTATGGTRMLSVKNLLVAFQIALCVVCLVAAGLAIRSLSRLAKVDLGFAPATLASLRIDLGRQGLDAATGAQVFDRVLERARALPGVAAATLANSLPLSEGSAIRTIAIEGRPADDANNNMLVRVAVVEPGYFRVAGIPLLSGRDLEDLDQKGTLAVAVINQAMARLCWQNLDALGQRFTVFGTQGAKQVVGVVGDSKQAAIGEAAQPQIYLSRRQTYVPSMALVLRAAGDPARVLGQVRDEVHRLEPALPLLDVTTMADRVERSLGQSRSFASLLAGFGLLALVLAALGIYGVTSYSVAQRSRELGIRGAIGAAPGTMVKMILGQGGQIVALGLAVGVAATLGLALGAGPALGKLFFGVAPTDLLTYAGTCLLLALVALAANWIPARRATHVNPVTILRSER